MGCRAILMKDMGLCVDTKKGAFARGLVQDLCHVLEVARNFDNSSHYEPWSTQLVKGLDRHEMGCFSKDYYLEAHGN